MSIFLYRPLGQEFTIRFVEVFETRIVRWPENIRLEIYESIRLTTNLLTQVFTGVPGPNITNENVQMDQNSFSSVLSFSYNHEGVGSGKKYFKNNVFSLFNYFNIYSLIGHPINFGRNVNSYINLNTSGILWGSVSWAVDEDGNVLAPTPSGAYGYDLKI